MADTLSPEARSERMSRIRSRGNQKTELRLLLILRGAKIHGWRRHASLYGSPDFLFRREKLAVFVDGCFWHGCACKKTPKTNTKFWRDKISQNRRRDRK